jgi:hypothetical protein
MLYCYRDKSSTPFFNCLSSDVRGMLASHHSTVSLHVSPSSVHRFKQWHVPGLKYKRPRPLALGEKIKTPGSTVRAKGICYTWLLVCRSGGMATLAMLLKVLDGGEFSGR